MEMQGPVHEIFAQLMRGLYGARLTRVSKNFRSKEGQPAVRCAYKVCGCGGAFESSWVG